jgi:hypothetical protein
MSGYRFWLAIPLRQRSEFASLHRERRLERLDSLEFWRPETAMFLSDFD